MALYKSAKIIFGELPFILDLQQNCLNFQKSVRLGSGRSAKLLRMFVDRPRQIIPYDEIVAALGMRENPQHRDVVISNVRSLFAEAADADPRIVRDVILTTRNVGVALNADVKYTNIQMGDFNFKEIEENERTGSDNISVLMNDVLHVYPDLKDFFYHTANGTPLPFHVLPPEFGRPEFPLPIIDDINPPPKREDSLYEQRRSAGKELYPGLIYRLVSARKGDWSLARTVYTELIESCDYLRSRIFSGWGAAYKKGGREERLSFLKNSPIVHEWIGNIKRIGQGDFSGYLAGMAFSIPIFQEMPDGSLRLLMAKGSITKQAGAGKLHVCPAGMLEFSLADEKKKELSLEAFRAYATKEMLEETLRNVTPKTEVEIASLDAMGRADRGDMYSSEILWSIITKQILGDWPEEKASLDAVRAIMEFDPLSSPMFVIVDAFILRPELIIPIYVTRDLKLMVNWENQVIDSLVFDDEQSVERRLSEQISTWVAPGLAAALLGARHHWNGR